MGKGVWSSRNPRNQNAPARVSFRVISIEKSPAPDESALRSAEPPPSAPPNALPLRRMATCLAAGFVVALIVGAVDAVVAPRPGEPLVERWARTAAHQRGRLAIGTALLLLGALPGRRSGRHPDITRKPAPERL